jgi:ABC-type multidrug transport system ATPase subunit
LCDKIGIITSGTIRTVGDQFRLKDIYGKGYFVSVSVDMDRAQLPSHSFRINRDYEDDPDETFEPHHSIMT